MKAKTDTKALNLSLPKELVKLIKIHCIENETDVSAVTERLYIEFLNERGSSVKKKKPKSKGAGWNNRLPTETANSK